MQPISLFSPAEHLDQPSKDCDPLDDGHTAAEAGICGAPVVTLADSGSADVVKPGHTQGGHTGWAVPLGDNAALAEAVDTILLAGG